MEGAPFPLYPMVSVHGQHLLVALFLPLMDMQGYDKSLYTLLCPHQRRMTTTHLPVKVPQQDESSLG